MAKPGRNDLCACGSGKKFKRCHGPKTEGGGRSSTFLTVVVGGAILAAIAVGIASFSGLANQSSSDRIWDPAHGHFHNSAGVQVP
jgi:hypothetical protein